MPSIADLENLLVGIDNKGYGAGKRVLGRYQADDMSLWFTYAPADRYAPPGRLIVQVDPHDFGFPDHLVNTDTRRTCLAHFLSHAAGEGLERGKLRQVRIDSPGQVVLARTSVKVETDSVQFRLGYHWEARGRMILGRTSAKIFCRSLPQLIRSLRFDRLDQGRVAKLVDCVENQQSIRSQLEGRDLVGFVGDGSILPREGNTDIPMKDGAVPFRTPPTLEVSFEVPHGASVSGLGIESGKLTCISGANFQGKTTLLEALGQGIYDHVPGDGRELVVCLPDLAFANKENRRIVNSTDISPFITKLPGVSDCRMFSSAASSGSTSQAASIIDAIESRVSAILIDEDDSAVNLLVKDNRLRRLVPGDIEPIRPLIDIVKSIPREKGITPIMVVGALGEFTEIADTIVMMHDFRVEDATNRIEEFRRDPTVELVPEVAEKLDRGVKEELGKAKTESRSAQLHGHPFGEVRQRKPKWSAGGEKTKVKPIGRDEISIKMGSRRTSIDLRGDIQKTLVEGSQVRAIGDAVIYSSRYMDGERTLRQVVDAVHRDTLDGGLDVISRFDTPGQNDYVQFSRHQLFYALSRFPWLQS